MSKLMVERIRQGHRTADFPPGAGALPERFRGRPLIEAGKCREGCRDCADACPTHAITTDPVRIDLGACLFCPACEEACSEGALRYTRDHRLAVRARGDLVVSEGDDAARLAAALDAKMRALFGRSLRLRQVS